MHIKIAQRTDPWYDIGEKVWGHMEAREALAESSDLLRKALIGYETAVLKGHYGDGWWEYGIKSALKKEGGEGHDGIDLRDALILLFADWDDVFSYYTGEGGLDAKCRRLSSRILESLDDIGRKDDDPDTKVHTILGNMAELCSHIDPDTSKKISMLRSCLAVPHQETGTGNTGRPVHPTDPFPKCGETEEGAGQDFIDACIRSANDLLIFGTLGDDGSRDGEAVNLVESYAITGTEDILCNIQGALVDGQEYSFVINNEKVPDDKVEFPYYDRDAHTLGVHLDTKTVEHLASLKEPQLKLVSDLSFLTRNVLDFLTDYGNMMSLPRTAPCFPEGSYPVPSSPPPTGSQRKAVSTVLNSGLSYVWGAPGTGKTQMVLATALVACIKAGQRVAVVAPTNLSVEQVLRGLIDRIDENPSFKEVVDPTADIVRLGTASEEFLSEYPEVCEKRVLDSLAERKRFQLERMRMVPGERGLPRARELLEILLAKTKEIERYEGTPEEEELVHECSLLRGRIERALDRNKELSAGLAGPKDIGRTLSNVRARLSEDSDIERYFHWTDQALQNAEERLDSELDMLILRGFAADARNPKIIACTPHMYIARYVPRGVSGRKPPFNVDRVFIDEAGYCGAVLAATLLANNVPVTLLGDHMQLPPVCSANRDAIEDAKALHPDEFANPDFMRFWYLWDMPSIYLESMFLMGQKKIEELHDRGLPPSVRDMRVGILTESYRFGSNLAEVLDRAVYRTGITGLGGSPLKILCIDVKSPEVPEMQQGTDGAPRPKRVNRNEIDAIVGYLDENPMSTDSFCILTPYAKQVSALNAALPDLAHRNILTVHRSQGREWDTVILSVQDGTHTQGLPEPLRFTSSKGVGLNLVNTAVSRAKRKLVLVCDRSFWVSRPDELIGMLAHIAEPYVLRDRPRP